MNWIMKNGLPAVFSYTSSASGAARARSQQSASAMSSPTSSRARGASLTSCTRVPDRLELQHQRMGGADFIVAIRTDQHEVPQIRPGEHVLEQIERRGVEPLQIVEKERQRMFGFSENPDESPQHELEQALRVLGREIGDGRLLSHAELELRDQVHHQPSVGFQRLAERVTPAGQLRLALAQKRLDQLPKGLGERGVG